MQAEEMPMPQGRPADADDLRVAVNRLLHVTRASVEQRTQLERALQSRIVIEQAKGMLAERLRLDIDDAFEVMRRTSRREQRRVHDIAREVLTEPETPAAILATLHAVLTERASAEG